jgi:succinoglycan biosynthesis protein ExoV
VFGEDFFCEIDPDRFIGIGSDMDDRHRGLPKVIFGAGARRPDQLSTDEQRLSVRFVRGPRTAAALSHLDVRYISDPAILMPLFYPRQREADGRALTIGFVPYFETPSELSSAIATALRLVVIEPTLSVEAFIEKLLRCDAVICEAMYGAILADAFRVPWRACRIGNGVNEGRGQPVQVGGLDGKPWHRSSDSRRVAKHLLLRTPAPSSEGVWVMVRGRD